MQIAGHGAAPNLLPVIATLLVLTQPFRLPAQTRVAATSGILQTQQRAMRYDTFGDPSSPATIIVLHGASGPSISFYQEQAMFFASHGYFVLFPHYFDATTDHTPSDANYHAWVQAVTDLLVEQRLHRETTRDTSDSWVCRWVRPLPSQPALKGYRFRQ